MPCQACTVVGSDLRLSVVCRYLTDESSGGALSNPEAELPLLPLPQLSFRTGGDEHWILIYQGLVKNLEHGQWWWSNTVQEVNL